VRVHSNPGERVLDFFAGSGTTGEAAVRNGRRAVPVDSNPEAVRVMARRLAFAGPAFYEAGRRVPAPADPPGRSERPNGQPGEPAALPP